MAVGVAQVGVDAGEVEAELAGALGLEAAGLELANDLAALGHGLAARQGRALGVGPLGVGPACQHRLAVAPIRLRVRAGRPAGSVATSVRSHRHGLTAGHALRQACAE